ncbi:hypothetical protein N9C70_01785 [Flavobacteriales bacterium]|nr:hypothetical protein [Flavobacteriales bacterium]
MKARIAIVTTKQPSTNPRMRKNADALSAAGHNVLVLYAFGANWADKPDEALFRNTIWTHQRIGGHPVHAPFQYFLSRVKRKWARWRNDIDNQFCPSIEAYIEALSSFQPQLVIGHNPGALPILSRVQDGLKVKVLFDAEDFHRGEFPQGSKEIELATQIEDQHVSKLTFLTAASPLTQENYQKLYPNIKCVTINNTFDLRLQPEFKTLTSETLKLCWFSQVVGLDRGLQEFLSHLAHARELELVITIVGNATDEVKSILSQVVTHPSHQLQFLPATSETELSNILSQHHIGLALEPGFSANNLIARSNKIFFYPLCGCLTLLSKTPGQLDFHREYPETGEIIDLDDPKSTVRILHLLAANHFNLDTKREAAWKLGHDTLNWETESKKLVSFVNQILQDAP